MNLATWIILIVLAGVVALVVRKMIRDKKAGKTCSGCGGCSGCSSSGGSSKNDISHK